MLETALNRNHVFFVHFSSSACEHKNGKNTINIALVDEIMPQTEIKR